MLFSYQYTLLIHGALSSVQNWNLAYNSYDKCKFQPQLFKKCTS